MYLFKFIVLVQIIALVQIHLVRYVLFYVFQLRVSVNDVIKLCTS